MCAYLGNGANKGTHTAGNILKFQSLMFSAYAAYGFTIVLFSCDHEFGIMLNKENILARGTKFDPKAPDAKAKRCERRIKTVKERDPATRTSLHFIFFFFFWNHFGGQCNKQRSMHLIFPCTANPLLAPREQYFGIRSDYKRDFCVALDDYCFTNDTSDHPIDDDGPVCDVMMYWKWKHRTRTKCPT